MCVRVRVRVYVCVCVSVCGRVLSTNLAASICSFVVPLLADTSIDGRCALGLCGHAAWAGACEAGAGILLVGFVAPRSFGASVRSGGATVITLFAIRIVGNVRGDEVYDPGDHRDTHSERTA